MKEYEPKWSDPRVQKKVKDVLDWCRFSLNEVAPTPMHHDKLVEVFGARNSAFGNYLRDALLVREGGYVVGTSAYGYKLNHAGVRRLRGMILMEDSQADGEDMVYTSPALVVKGREHELKDLQFTYTESSDRFWHPFQNIKRDAKAEFWNPYLPYDYDIEACAPTVLFQLAQGLKLPEILMTEVKDYLAHKAAWRSRMADLTGLSLPDAKRLLNSLFNGARLVPHHSCAAYRLVGYDREKLMALKQDKEFRMLRNSIKNIWGAIARELDLNLSSGKAKWSVYFKFERRILTAIKEFLEAEGVRHFTEHDGFRTNREIDLPKLCLLIQDKTGFKMKISYNS